MQIKYVCGGVMVFSIFNTNVPAMVLSSESVELLLAVAAFIGLIV